VGKPEGKRPLGRTRHTGVDNITMDFREKGWVGMNWTDLGLIRELWRALVNTVMNLGMFLSSCTTYGFSRR
jgi:hypothetical protein